MIGVNENGSNNSLGEKLVWSVDADYIFSGKIRVRFSEVQPEKVAEKTSVMLFEWILK